MNASSAQTDEQHWTWGAWLTLALTLGYLLTCVMYTLLAVRQPSEGWFSNYDSSTGWVVTTNQGGADGLQLGDRINAIAGANVDIVLGPRYEPPPNWRVGGLARYTVVRDERMIEVDVPLVQRADSELLASFTSDSSIVFQLGSVLIAFVIFWLRPGNIVARLLLGVLVLFFGSSIVYYASWSPAMFFFPPLLHTASLLITPWALLYAMVAHLALSFPLRAWPLTRWPRLVPAVLYGTIIPVYTAFLALAMTAYFALFTALLVVMLIALLGAPIYHLRTQRDPVPRAQVAWATLGLGMSFGGTMIGSVLATLLPASAPYVLWLGALGFMLLPVCLGIAITRYRLFDIAIIIRRTLVYSTLTLSLGAIYLLTVVALQALFVRLTGQESTLAVVASTLAIAALFGPLRAWVQSFIDRRFFRKKYDAQQVLHQFAARAQQQADLDALSTDLLATVDETLKPEQVTLWLTRAQETRQ
jgi:hypothetical protein